MDKRLKVYLLNIQGITMQKKIDVEKLMTENEEDIKIIGLVETHVREDRLNWGDDWQVYEQRREQKDKKGGGLMILHQSSEQIKLEKHSEPNRDILIVSGTVGTHKLQIVLVYFATGSNQESKQRNKRIRDRLEEVLETEDNVNRIVMGDFNGHINNIGKQKEDENGRMIKELSSKYNLTIANMDDRCEGERTWERGHSYSTIDYVMINNTISNKFLKMKIDEEQRWYDLSDHNLIEATFKWQTEKKWNKGEQEVKYYWKLNEQSLKEYREDLEIRLDCGQINDIQQYNNAMRAAANNKLKRRYIRKKNKNEEEPPWMNREIKNGIKLRRKTNRERRNENNPQKREELWLKYKQIKMETQIKIRNRMREYEEKQTEEIKSNRNCSSEASDGIPL